jgi:hypothetical protein
VPVSTLERNPVVVGSAQDILERLERYAAARRGAVRRPPAAPRISPQPPRPLLPRRVQVHPVHIGPTRLDAATVDLFPYDLVATILGCAATILASIAFTRPLALLLVGGLAGSAEWARRTRWFPSLATNLMLGTAIGLVLVLTA